MALESPLAAFLRWYRNLPVTDRQDIAYVMIVSIPIFGEKRPNLEIDDVVSQFENVISSHVNDLHRNVGVSLAIRQNVEFFIMAKRRTPTDWESMAVMLQQKAIQRGGSEQAAQELHDKFLNGKEFSELAKSLED
jgi:hypothetical protein